MDIKKDLCCKGKFLSFCLLCIVVPALIISPGSMGRSCAEVIIDDPRMLGVDLDDEPHSGDKSAKATITSTGSVTSSGAYAVRGGSTGWNVNIEAGGSVENTASGSGNNAILFNTKQDGSGTALAGNVTNSGTIESAGTGIKMGGGTVTNGKTGTITSTNDAICTTGITTITNSGSIKSTAGNGVAAWGDAAITNNNSISGYDNGIISNAYTTVDNYGSIRGDKTSGVYLTKGRIINHAGATINLTGIGMLSSTILFAGDGDVENSGEIRGHRGIHFGTDGKVINNVGGTITGTADWGIIFGKAGTLINYGTIEGAVAGVTFNMYKSGNDILDNSGTIIGRDGTAVSMGAGDDTAYLRGGSAITGNVDGGAGTGDKAYLYGSGEIKNGTLLNFETIEKSGAGTFTLDGDLSSGPMIRVLGGTLRVNGSFTHEAGATRVVGAGPDGNVGKISAAAATINGGTVEVDTSTGIRGGRHTIVETDLGLAGTYGRLAAATNSDYISASLSYDADNAYIDLTSNFEGAALTENQQAVASSLDSTYNTASGDVLKVYGAISTLNGPALRSAYDQMGGASHTTFAAVDIYRVVNFYRNLFGRSSPNSSGASITGKGHPPVMFAENTASISDSAAIPAAKSKVKGNPFSLWVRTYGASGDRSGDDIASRYDFTIGSAIAGMEHLFAPGLRAGAAFGYSRTDMNMKDLRDSGNEYSFQGAFYGSYASENKKWYIDTAFACSMNRYDTKRYLSFGTIDRTAKGSYDGSDISGYIESGYLLPAKGLNITPYISFLAIESRRDGFTESGADALDLDADSETTTSLQGGLGIRIAKEFTISKSFFLTSEFSAKWIHEFGDDRVLLNARFAGAPSGSFIVSSDIYDRDSGVLSLGLMGRMNDTWGFFLAYDAQLRSKEFAYAVAGGVRFSW